MYDYWVFLGIMEQQQTYRSPAVVTILLQVRVRGWAARVRLQVVMPEHRPVMDEATPLYCKDGLI